MRELDRVNYTNNAYLRGITNRMSIDVIDPTKKITFNVRLLNSNTARMYVTVLDSGSYHVDRHYDFEMNVEQAKHLLQLAYIDDTIQDYTYTIEYQDSRCRVTQYEKLPEGKTRIVHQTWLDSVTNLNWFSDQLQVVQPPVIILDKTELTLYNKLRVYVSSQILTKEDSLISVFIVEFNGESRPYYILPVSRFGETLFEININLKSYSWEEELPLKVIAVDNEGHKATTEIFIPVNRGKLFTPSVISPVIGQPLSDTGFEIAGSPFSVNSLAYRPEHVRTDYKITSDAKGEEIVWEYSTDNKEELTSCIVSFESGSSPLKWDVGYYIWIRYEDAQLGYSDWSDYVYCTVQDDIVIDVTPPVISGVNHIGLVGYNYVWTLKSKPLTGNYIDHFTVTISALDSVTEIELKPTSNSEDGYYEAQFSFTPAAEMQGKQYYITVTAVDDNGISSMFTGQYVDVLPALELKENKYYVTQGESITITNNQLLINSNLSSIASQVDSVVYSNPVNGELTVTENGVIFTSTNLTGYPAGFDYTVTDSFGGTSSAHVTLIVTRLPDIQAFVLSKIEREDYVQSYNPLSSSPQSLFDYQANRKFVYDSASGDWNITDITMQQEFGYPRNITCPETGKSYCVYQYSVSRIS